MGQMRYKTRKKGRCKIIFRLVFACIIFTGIFTKKWICEKKTFLFAHNILNQNFFGLMKMHIFNVF